MCGGTPYADCWLMDPGGLDDSGDHWCPLPWNPPWNEWVDPFKPVAVLWNEWADPFRPGAAGENPARPDPRPGGAASPGGGPLAVVNPFWGLRVRLDMAWVMVDAAGVGVCPDRTPSGFLEKLKRMPPLTLLCS
jgi:hypothetical protein